MWSPISTIGEAELLPRWHGVAYAMHGSRRHRTAVVPLNFVLAAGRWLQRRLVFDWVPDARRRDALHDAFVRGFRAGTLAERELSETEFQKRYQQSIDRSVTLFLQDREAHS